MGRANFCFWTQYFKTSLLTFWPVKCFFLCSQKPVEVKGLAAGLQSADTLGPCLA